MARNLIQRYRTQFTVSKNELEVFLDLAKKLKIKTRGGCRDTNQLVQVCVDGTYCGVYNLNSIDKKDRLKGDYEVNEKLYCFIRSTISYNIKNDAQAVDVNKKDKKWWEKFWRQFDGFR